MDALLKIQSAGFDVSLYGDSFKIAPADKLTVQQREFLKAHKAEIITELSTYQKIITWLASIGETDQSIIDETIDRCRSDIDAIAYFIQRANDNPPKGITNG